MKTCSINFVSLPGKLIMSGELQELVRKHFANHYGAVDWHLEGSDERVDACNWCSHSILSVKEFLEDYEKLCADDWYCEVHYNGDTFTKDSMDSVEDLFNDILSYHPKAIENAIKELDAIPF